MIRYSSIVPNSHVDGPGSRTVVFLQGCSIGCRGCQNKHLWPAPGGKEIHPHSLAVEIMKHGNPNITISGGEPTDQLDELYWLLTYLREAGAEHIIVYTGRTFEWLVENRLSAFMKAFNLVDILVDGPFILELDDPLITWRGSRNQRPIDVKATLATGDLVVIDWSRPEIVIDDDGNLHLPAGLASGFQPAGDLIPSRRCGETTQAGYSRQSVEQPVIFRRIETIAGQVAKRIETMIWHPRPGQRVRLNYKNKAMPFQGACGVIRLTAQGHGPLNALVLLDTGERVIVPRGNLVISPPPNS